MPSTQSTGIGASGRGDGVPDPTWVFAVDPGKMTGWAWACLEPALLTPGADWRRSMITGQDTADEFLDMVADNGFCDPRTLFVVESFTVTAHTARKSPQPEPMEVIGAVKFLARRGGSRLEMQTPSSAKRFATDTKLRQLGLWVPGQDHARDAIRHLILGIVSFTAGQAREEMIQSLA
jgi:hypothetical protein